jgi:hypothetical protein
MNQNLIEAMTSIERARALLFAYEKVFLDLDVEPEDQERADMAISIFYAIRESVDQTADLLDLVDGDCRVVDAIYAVNDVRRRASTLTSED